MKQSAGGGTNAATSHKEVLNAAPRRYLLSSRTAGRYRDKTPPAISLSTTDYARLIPRRRDRDAHLAVDQTIRAVREYAPTRHLGANACCASPSQHSSALPSGSVFQRHTGATGHILRHGCARRRPWVIRSVPHFATGSRSAVDQRRERSACQHLTQAGMNTGKIREHLFFTAVFRPLLTTQRQWNVTHQIVLLALRAASNGAGGNAGLPTAPVR